MDDLIPEYSKFFDPRLLNQYERASIEKRIRDLRRQMSHVLEAGRKLRIPSAGGPPPRSATDAATMDPLLRLVREIVEGQSQNPGIKPAVVKKVLDDVCRLYLWSNLSTLPAFHELTVLVPYWAGNQAMQSRLQQFADFTMRSLLHGIVLSLQTVREEVLEADEVYLAHCACRSAGIVDDLEQDGRVWTLVNDEDGRRLLDRLVDRYETLDADRLGRTTHASLRAILDDLVKLRHRRSPDYRLERLFQATWHSWEILPVKPGFTTNWVRSLQNNNKAASIDQELAFEMVNIFFHGRGALFNSMKCVDSPYTICTCPSPENGGGCVLTNWYYYGNMNSSLIPADDHYGRRRDVKGRLLPCRYFPIRARRDCIGCGCNHSRSGPRDLDASLSDADTLLKERERSPSQSPVDPPSIPC